MTKPITLEICEGRRTAYNTQNTQDDEDDSIVLPDGEIVDTKEDRPVVADNPSLEKYLRQVLANTSRFQRARMYMATALGYSRSKLPWRLLNAILAYERNSLGVKAISDERNA